MAQPIIRIRYFKRTKEFRIITRDDKTGDQFEENRTSLTMPQMLFLQRYERTKRDGEVSVTWGEED